MKMGMLDLFREWQNSGSKKFRPRRRRGLERAEVLEFRRMLSVVLIGTTVRIDGSATPDNVTISQNSSGVSVTENGTVTSFGPSKPVDGIYFFGGTGDDQVCIQGILPGTSLGVFGGSGVNTLISPNSTNLWQITGPNSGTLNGNTFTNVQNLTGGTFNDSFQFGPAGFVSGKIDGGGGIDALDYSLRTAGVVVNLATNSATAVGSGFSRISDVYGSSDTTDTLIGDNNVLNNWYITSGNAGNINGQFYFSGIKNLTGGPQSNSFLFGASGFVSGNIIGGSNPGPGNVNTLVYSQRSAGVVTNLQTSNSTAIGGTFSQISALVGSSANDDTLIGSNGNNIWNITALNEGSVGIVNGNSPLSFAGYENLVGGTGSDAFKLAATPTTPGVTPWLVAGSINGGLGFNTIDYSQRTDAVSVNLIANSASLIFRGFSNIQNFVGSKPSSSTLNTLYGQNVNTDWNITGVDSGNLNNAIYFSSFQNLNGGGLNDTFHFIPGAGVASVAGVINGGSGTNTLDYSQSRTTITVGLQPDSTTKLTPASGTGGYKNITNLIGSTYGSTLVGASVQSSPSSQTIWNITDRNTGNVNGTFNFTGVNCLTSGDKDPNTGLFVNNVFRMFQNGLITGKIDGKSGADNWLDYSAFATQVTVNLAAGIATNVGSFLNIKDVHGGNGINTLTGNYQGNALIGGTAADTIVAGSGTGQNLIIGGLGSDVLTGISGAVDSKGKAVGNSGQDLIIGGFTNYDNNLVALTAIIDEWQSPTPFATRVQNLRTGGGLSQGNRLVADVTVRSDAAVNAITGGKPESNWLWGQPAEFKDLTSADVYNTPIVNPPILSGTSSPVFTVGQSAVAVNPAITVTDPGHLTMTSATITIANFDPTQDALGFVPSSLTGNIKSSFDSTKGILTLTSLNSTATVAQFQTALRSVAYLNSSATPTLTPRTINFQVYDSFATSNNLSTSVGINFAPSLAGGNTTITYTALQAPTVVNSIITVTDANNFSLSSATVKLSYSFFPLEDVLGFVGNASTGNITGSYNSATGVLTLTSAGALATVANFQAALRLVTYSNISATPSLFSRTVSYQVSDGVIVSNVVSSTVVVK